MQDIAMFKIGEFSRLTRVSLKTLHHYDDIGLFKPSHVDPFSGYRYYTAEQLPRLNRLLALKALGFTLEQIGRVLDGGLNADELRGMLRLRRAELERERAETDARLAEVEIRLRQIEQEDIMPQIDILTKVVGPMSTQDLLRSRPQTDGEQPLIADEWRQSFEYDMVDPGNEQLVLPAATVAYAVYHGSYADFVSIGRMHVALQAWIADHNRKIAGPAREIYLAPNEREGALEIQYPIS